MKVRIQSLLKSIVPPILGVLLSWFLCRHRIRDFQYFIEPPFSPLPGTALRVWLLLSVTPGISAGLAKQSHAAPGSRREALLLYTLQLILLFLWSVFFFRMHWFFFSFIWLLFQWAILWMTVQSFYAIRKSAGLFLIPILLWVSFYGYINLFLALLN